MVTAGYLFEQVWIKNLNKRGINCWYFYLKEIFSQMGLTTVDEFSLSDLGKENRLAKISVLFIGNLPENGISPKIKKSLRNWIEKGGILIGFSPDGMDELFGIKYAHNISQPVDDFTPSAYFKFTEHPIAQGIHSAFHNEQMLLIFSPVRAVTLDGAEEVAHLYDLAKEKTGYSAITLFHCGSGLACYFAFDVPKTIWVLHQGRPVDKDHDGDGYLRTIDAIVIGDNEPEVLYADEIIFLIQNIVSTAGLPMIHQLPPYLGKVPDALFFWGGDDDGDSGVQVPASNWMRVKGLPYHINLMPNLEGDFAVSKKEISQIESNGHELSLHFNFMDGFDHPSGYTKQDVEKQVSLYRTLTGKLPICTVSHWVRWCGWTEPAKWFSESGVLADNSFFAVSRSTHLHDPHNPINTFGFSFGTAYPFYFYEGYEQGNKRLNFIELPITAYELRYDGKDNSLIHRCIDLAAYYHLTVNMFFHPCYIKDEPQARAAIEEILRYIEEKKLLVINMGPDELCIWWNERNKSKIKNVVAKENSIEFEVFCYSSRGLIVKIVSPAQSRCHVTDTKNKELYCEKRNEFGKEWLYIVIPQGKEKVKIEY